MTWNGGGEHLKRDVGKKVGMHRERGRGGKRDGGIYGLWSHAVYMFKIPVTRCMA